MAHYCPTCGRGFEPTQSTTCPDDGQRLRRIGNGDDRRLGLLIQERFRLIEVLGRGGAGVVYRAVQLPIGRQVAVKILTETDPDHTIGGVERFFREARLASTLRHPNIVSPVDFGEDRRQGIIYFAMEYIEGIDLARLLEDHRVTLPLALEILFQTCGALTDAHDKGIIHRDLKPGNVRLTAISDGTLQAKVLDLGLARPIDTTDDITRSGNLAGTLSYLPPEYILDGDLGAYSDLYSLGIMFFELLTGKKPFTGNHVQILCHHVSTTPPNIVEHICDVTDFPPALADDILHFFRRLVAKKPAFRFRTARDVREAINALRSVHALEESFQCDISQSVSVDTFRPWLAPACATPKGIETLPSDAIENLKRIGAQMVAIDDDEPKIQFPTPPPLPASLVDDGHSQTPPERSKLGGPTRATLEQQQSPSHPPALDVDGPTTWGTLRFRRRFLAIASAAIAILAAAAITFSFLGDHSTSSTAHSEPIVHHMPVAEITAASSLAPSETAEDGDSEEVSIPILEPPPRKYTPRAEQDRPASSDPNPPSRPPTASPPVEEPPPAHEEPDEFQQLLDRAGTL